ncbi:MAG TPA: aminotransferase class V-fold PLP-dependent enzyme [Rhodothermales bacterium]|nr:aminotransferase class V-fold PLP-dependent enzyme [Rhodothermales bacterium]
MNLDDLPQLERESRRLDPGSEERSRLTDAVFAYASRYLDSIPNAPAYFQRSDRGVGVLETPISEEGVGIDRVLSILDEHVDSVGINTTSGRFLGYIPGGGLFYSALGDFLAAVSNRYASVFFASPGATRIENQLVRWMGEIVGYPTDCAGYLAAGGSHANLSAIVTARDHHGIEGAGVARAVVYLTEHAHHCIEKALNLAGLRSCARRFVPVDDSHRMRASQLEVMIQRDRADGLIPWMVVASAGTTNTGSVDPLDEIAQVAHGHGLWYHVDGAYGAFFVLCPEGARVLGGMDRSDSLVMDPHKTMFLPYGTGALLVREGRRLHSSHATDADYLQDTLGADQELSPADLSPELTKHFRGLRFWLPLQVLGLAPFRAALSEKIQLARHFHERLSAIKGFEVGPYPDLSVVTYRYFPRRGDADAFNRALLAAIHEDGRVFVTSTQLEGKFTLRMVAVCFRTHLADIETAIEVLVETAGRLEAG